MSKISTEEEGLSAILEPEQVTVLLREYVIIRKEDLPEVQDADDGTLWCSPHAVVPADRESADMPDKLYQYAVGALALRERVLNDTADMQQKKIDKLANILYAISDGLTREESVAQATSLIEQGVDFQ